MQDAFNLAWKLALVHHGKARREILSSYTQERSEVGEMVLRNAGIFTRVATLRNPVLRFMRNHLMAFAGKLDAVQERAIAALSELDIHYPNSPLNCDDHGDAWDKTMQVGDRLPDANMRCSHNKPIRLLDAIRGPGYTLLLLPESGDLATVDGMATSARHVTRQYAGLVKSVVVLPGETKEFNQLADISIVLVDAEREFRKRLGLQGSALALVRPDGYLAFRGDAGSWSKLGEYFAKWLIATDAEHELQTAGGQRTPEFCQ